jgi:hypothetical protein
LACVANTLSGITDAAAINLYNTVAAAGLVVGVFRAHFPNAGFWSKTNTSSIVLDYSSIAARLLVVEFARTTNPDLRIETSA